MDKLLLIISILLTTACVTSDPKPAEAEANNQTASAARSSRPSSAVYGQRQRQLIKLPIRQQVQLKISLDDGPTLGNPDAKIGIVEFTDFECSHCARYHRQVFPKVKEHFIDQQIVRYVVKDFPLKKMHRNAMNAAIAANCALSQNQYWAMQDKLFSNQGQLNKSAFSKYAADLKLDVNAYTNCLTDPSKKLEVQQDMIVGKQLDIRGTPTFFIGTIQDNILKVNRVAKGVPSFETIANEIKILRSEKN